MGFFGRSKGEFVESNNRNYNIKSDRGKHGEVTVEGQDRYLWGSRLGDWNEKGSFPNEKAAHNFIDKDSRK